MPKRPFDRPTRRCRAARSIRHVLGSALLGAALAAAAPAAASAQSFNSCTIAQKDLTVRSGVERPVAPEYDEICVAVLPPTCRNFTAEGKPCAYRACLVRDDLRGCPNGEPVMFTAATIEPFVAQPVRPISQAELAAMNRAIEAEARKLAARWTDNGRVPLGPAAQTALQNVACQLHAFNNPDVRCVPR